MRSCELLPDDTPLQRKVPVAHNGAIHVVKYEIVPPWLMAKDRAIERAYSFVGKPPHFVIAHARGVYRGPRHL